jgi:hypothetical protein
VYCVALAGFGLSVGCAAAPTQAQSTETGPTAIVRSLDDALNAHDANAVLSMFAKDAVVQEDRRPQTPEQIQGWVEELIRQQIRLDLVDQPSISPDVSTRHATTVTWRARLDMQMYRAMGRRYVPATLRAIVVDGQVAFLSIRPEGTWTTWPDGTQLT